MRMPADGTRVRWIAVGLVAAMMLLAALLVLVYSWIARKPFDVGMVAGSVAAPIGIFITASIARKGNRRPLIQPLPEPSQTLLREALDSVGLKSVVTRYIASGQAADYPRILPFGLSLAISKRVLDDYTPEALRWSIKTDALAGRRLTQVVVPPALVGLLAAMAGIALCERWKATDGWLAGPGALAIGSLVFIAVGGTIEQVRADQRITHTEADRQAAKEALSYPFFAQKAKPLERWMYSRRELQFRAKRLGIELEQGYKVPRANRSSDAVDTQ